MSSADLLHAARARSGMTQRALAAASRVPQSTIARIERGTVVPRVDTLERLLRATGMTLTTEPRLGVGVDRSQIRALLRLSPRQRLELLSADAAALAELDAARQRP